MKNHQHDGSGTIKTEHKTLKNENFRKINKSRDKKEKESED